VDKLNSVIIDALRFLGQPLPDTPQDASREELWQWAIEHWDIRSIPAGRELPAPERYTASPATS